MDPYDPYAVRSPDLLSPGGPGRQSDPMTLDMSAHLPDPKLQWGCAR